MWALEWRRLITGTQSSPSPFPVWWKTTQKFPQNIWETENLIIVYRFEICVRPLQNFAESFLVSEMKRSKLEANFDESTKAEPPTVSGYAVLFYCGSNCNCTINNLKFMSSLTFHYPFVIRVVVCWTLFCMRRAPQTEGPRKKGCFQLNGGVIRCELKL